MAQNTAAISIPVYRCWVHFLWDIGKVDAQERLEKKFGIKQGTFDLDEEWCAYTVYVDTSNIAVIIEEMDWSAYCWDSINHEFMHVVGHILRQRGIPFTEESEEAYCYLMGYITREFIKEYTAQTKRRKLNKSSKKEHGKK